jgi:single-stranded DNA-binding protein
MGQKELQIMARQAKQYADKDINTVIVGGNIVDPKYFPARDGMQDKIIFKLANSDDYEQQDGTIVERTNWIQIEISGGRAKGLQNLIMNRWASVTVEGKLTGVNAYVKDDGKAAGNPVVRVGRDHVIKPTRWKDNADQGTQRETGYNGAPGDDIPF